MVMGFNGTFHHVPKKLTASSGQKEVLPGDRQDKVIPRHGVTP